MSSTQLAVSIGNYKRHEGRDSDICIYSYIFIFWYFTCSQIFVECMKRMYEKVLENQIVLLCFFIFLQWLPVVFIIKCKFFSLTYKVKVQDLTPASVTSSVTLSVHVTCLWAVFWIPLCFKKDVLFPGILWALFFYLAYLILVFKT